MLPPPIAAWKARIEALPFFEQDDPAALEGIVARLAGASMKHDQRLTMRLMTTAFADGQRIPGEFAFCATTRRHVKLSSNLNPDFAWSDLPPETKSLALICHDPDVPSRRDDVNREGHSVSASLPRVDFFHWVLIDLPPNTADLAR